MKTFRKAITPASCPLINNAGVALLSKRIALLISGQLAVTAPPLL